MRRIIQWAVIGLIVASIYCPWAFVVFERRHPWCPITSQNWTETVPAALTWQRVEPEDFTVSWIEITMWLYHWYYGDGDDDTVGGGGAGGGGGGAG
jgi:hypothetical protein